MDSDQKAMEKNNDVDPYDYILLAVIIICSIISWVLMNKFIFINFYE